MNRKYRSFRKLAEFDVAAFKERLILQDHLFSDANPSLKEGDLGYSHKDTNVILCRYAPMAPDIATNAEEQKKTKNNLFAVDYEARAAFADVLDPLIYRLLWLLKGTHLGGIGIIRLPAGKKIEKHYDLGLSAQFYERFHITINGPEECQFICGEGDNEERVAMRDGEVWWFDARELHSVENHSSKDRVSISCDINGI
jgi:Aspartyl/Asparaginyl beta-hydroxylase